MRSKLVVALITAAITASFVWQMLLGQCPVPP